MKILFLVVCSVVAGRAFAFDDELTCDLKTCALDLLNFRGLTFGGLIKKIQAAVFCIKHCTPPIVQEFFESLSFAFTKKITGKCRHRDCAEHNRFVALGFCAEKEAWPLVQCGKILVDLAQLPLVPVDPVNTTCGIVIETMRCIEETLKRCGTTPFSLMREITEKPLNIFLNSYCNPSHREKGKSLLVTRPPIMDLRDGILQIDDETDLIPVAKVRKGGPNSSNKMAASFLSILTCLVAVLASSSY